MSKKSKAFRGFNLRKRRCGCSYCTMEKKKRANESFLNSTLEDGIEDWETRYDEIEMDFPDLFGWDDW